MPTTLQPKILLITLKYDFKAMQRENSPNEVQKWYPRGTIFSGVQTVQMGYSTPKWGTVGKPVRNSNLVSVDRNYALKFLTNEGPLGRDIAFRQSLTKAFRRWEIRI